MSRREEFAFFLGKRKEGCSDTSGEEGSVKYAKKVGGETETQVERERFPAR